MGLEHTQVKSRQCAGMSDPEGAQPNAETDNSPSAQAAFANEPSRGTKFDDPAPDCTKEGKMEEEHTSNTR